MNEKNEPPKVLDLKPMQRGGSRLAQSKIAQFSPDEDLIQSTGRIKNQRDIILDRINRMETATGRVSQGVFEKVRRDYTMQLDTINELLDEKKQILKDEIRKLYMIREKITVEVNRHREILEEADFRHYLNEFTQSQYQEVENFETKEIEKAESDLAHVNQWIRVHEDLFDPQDFGHKATPPAKPQPRSNTAETQTAYRPQKPAREPATQSFAAEPPAPAKPAPTQTRANEPTEDSADYSHLFTETPSTSPRRENEDVSAPAPLQNLDELMQEVQASAEKVDFLATDAPGPAKPEQDSATANKLEAKTEDEIDYFANQDISESSFKIQSKSLQHQQEPKAEVANPGESVTVARTAVKTNTKPVDLKKEDSISDILESIRLEGEDELGDTNSALPQQDVTTDYKLKLIEGDLDVREFPLKSNTSIGRSPSNDVFLKEPKVSRQHAAINLYNDSYILVDLKSSNGVFVNGTKVDETVLHAGDEVSIGGYKFIFMKND